MRFGRGFGFRGWSPPWPYVGLGRGGLPRCWAYGPFWASPYSYPYGMTYPYDIGTYPYGWGIGYPPHSPMYSYGYPAGYPYTPGPFAGPYGSPMAPEEEKEWLKSQADVIHQQIDQINSRIAELEKE
jgi:hypothetical protein